MSIRRKHLKPHRTLVLRQGAAILGFRWTISELATYPPADMTIECIGDLLRYDLPAILAAGHAGTSKAASESTHIGEKS